MKLRGLPVERLPRWDNTAVHRKDKADLKERLAQSRLQSLATALTGVVVNLPYPS